MKKPLLLLIMCALLIVAAGCVPTVAPAADQTSGEAGEAPAAAAPEGPTTIVMWHSMSGTLGETLTKLADTYNATHTNYQIELQFQGPYADALTDRKSVV